MRKLPVAVAAVVFMAGIVAVHLWFELRTERERGRDLEARVAALESAPPAPDAAVPEAIEAVPEVQTPAAVVARNAPVPVQPVPAAPRAEPAAESARAPAAGMLEAMQTPQGRELTRSMMRGVMAQMYPDVAAELGLTAEETDRLFAMLTRQQEDLGMDSMSLLGGGAGNPEAASQVQSRLVEKERAHQREQQAMLGSKYPQWEEYQSTAAARQQVQQLNTTLGASGNPLSEAQSKSLIAAFAREQAKTRQEERDWMASAAAASSPNLLQESMQRALAGQRRLVDASAPHLDSTQLAQFRRQVEQQERMLQATMGLLGGQGTKP